MKPRNREVNIFNMSVLDLLTGALGAFCFLTLALFPYYFKAKNASASTTKPNATPSNAAELEAQNESLKKQIDAEKASGKQMQPFVTMLLLADDQNNNPCASLRLKSATVPPGAPPIGYRVPDLAADGSPLDYYIFALQTGEYHITVNVTGANPNCPVTISTINANSRNITHNVSQPGDVDFDIVITGDDFPASLFD
jgi:hypothetical protein